MGITEIKLHYSNTERYYKELELLINGLKYHKEKCDKFNRRRGMAKHSKLNSKSFVERITEGEESSIKEIKRLTKKKLFFDEFTLEEWKNNLIIFTTIITNNNIEKWCVNEFGYKPYIKRLTNSHISYIFHSQEDAMGIKLRW